MASSLSGGFLFRLGEPGVSSSLLGTIGAIGATRGVLDNMGMSLLRLFMSKFLSTFISKNRFSSLWRAGGRARYSVFNASWNAAEVFISIRLPVMVSGLVYDIRTLPERTNSVASTHFKK